MTPQDTRLDPIPRAGWGGLELPAARPSHRDRPNGETAARTTVLVGEGRGRRAATRALLIAVLLVAFDDYGPCGGPMTSQVQR